LSVLAYPLILAALVLAFANGSNDNFKAVATLYGSGAMGYRAALRLATGAQIAGSLASVVIAGTLLKAFSGKGLVPADVVANPAFLMSVGVGAAVSVLLATRLGLPVSTTHALIGVLVGAGIALEGNVAWGALGRGFFLPLLVSPLLAFASAAVLYPTAHGIRKRLGIGADTCVCVGTRVTPVAVGADGALELWSPCCRDRSGRVAPAGRLTTVGPDASGMVPGLKYRDQPDARPSRPGWPESSGLELSLPGIAGSRRRQTSPTHSTLARVPPSVRIANSAAAVPARSAA
jgi:hypothetical protein